MELLYYSMGNFVSNQRKPKTDGGAMVRIEFIRNGSELQYFRCRLLSYLGIYSDCAIQEEVLYPALFPV